METKTAFAKKWLLWQIPLLLFAILYALAFRRADAIGSDFFRCRIAASLHLYCPGCGGSRAVDALLRGRLLSSLRYFAPVPITAALLLLSDLRMALFLLGKGSFPSRRFGFSIMILCVALVLFQFFLRNALLFFGIDLLGDIL